MTTTTRILAAVAASLAAALPIAQSAHATPIAPTIPPAIAVPAGHTAFQATHAVGVQIYSCNGTAWSLLAPRADLYDRRGTFVGIHYGGPTWRYRDGSSVVAQKVDGVTVDPTAIPWLLLSRVSSTPGYLGHTTYIQRINTTGGLAPAAGKCHASTAGATDEVPYTADYVFFKAAPLARGAGRSGA